MDLEEYRFPLFLDLRGRKAVVAGGGTIALRRIHVLLRFGARVTMISPECQKVPQGVEWICRPYARGDLAGAFLAVAATDNRTVNRQIGLDAAQEGIFVSVADCREESSFFFPAICVGSGLVSGVVSQGADHHKTARAARAIRTLLEEME